MTTKIKKNYFEPCFFPRLLHNWFNGSFAGSGHIVRNKLCWDANSAVGFSRFALFLSLLPFHQCKKQIDVSFSCVCPVIDNEFLHKIVKEVFGSLIFPLHYYVVNFQYREHKKSITIFTHDLNLCRPKKYALIKCSPLCVGTLAGGSWFHLSFEPFLEDV